MNIPTDVTKEDILKVKLNHYNSALRHNESRIPICEILSKTDDADGCKDFTCTTCALYTKEQLNKYLNDNQ